MNTAPEQPALGDSAPHKIGDLAHYTVDYVRTWSELFAHEAELARICANRLLLATVWVCFIVFGVVVTSNALTAALFNRWLQNWASALALTLLANLVVLLLLLLGMRSWWRKLSLPRSRRALSDLIHRIHEADGAGAAR
jgi:H+/Cl- antiporter ClcA